jgi:hypothetical protein
MQRCGSSDSGQLAKFGELAASRRSTSRHELEGLGQPT